MPPLPRAFTPTPAGGAGWSGWAKPAPPSLTPSGPVPAGNPVSPPKTISPPPWGNTPGKLPGNGAPAPQPYTSPPAPRGPGFGPPAQPKPTSPTPKPASPPSQPGRPSPSMGSTMGAGAAAGAAAAAAAAAAAGVTAPAWLVGGAMLLGAAAAAAIANQIWPPAPGDGTEGAPQTQTIPVPPVPGVPGKVAGKAYQINGGMKYLGPYGWSPSTFGYQNTLTGPISVELKLLSGRFVDVVVTHAGGVANTRLYDWGSAKLSGARWEYLQITRADGTNLQDDIAGGSAPGTSGVEETTTTPAPTPSPSPSPPTPPAPFPPGATPTAPPPIAPPSPRIPTPSGTPTTGSPNPQPSPTPSPSPNPQPSPTPSPSPNPQPAPPVTAKPSAPSTGAGTPSNQTPTTGPRPSSSPSSSGGSSPSSGGLIGTSPGEIAALIAGTSPGVAGAVGAINNSAQPKQPTPTGAPISLPGDNSPTTGPDNRPPGQGDPSVIPGTKTPITNSNGEVIGTKQEFLDKDGKVIYSTTTSTTTTSNTVRSQINQTNIQTTNIFNNIVQNILNPSPTPTTNTTVKDSVTNQDIKNSIDNSINTLNTTTTETINQSTTTITQNIDASTNTVTSQLTELLEKSDVDLASTLAILGTLATAVALEQSKNQTLTAIGNIPTPTPCTYPTYHPQNQAERAAISGKVDGVNTVLGTVTNVQIAEAKTGITSIVDKLGSPIAGGAATVFEGINKIQEWGDKFSKSLRLDRVYNALAFMLQIHNAAILSRNLGESLGFLIDASLQALNLKDEKDEELNLTQIIGTSIENFIKSIVGNDIYNGLSRQWKLISAIYTAAINVYEMSLSAFGGLAEGVSVIGEYQGKIGNALKRSGGVMQNAYDWMEENFKIKMTKAGYLGRVADGLQEAEDVVSNVTEFPESINEVQETYKEASEEIKEARILAEQLRLVKVEKEEEGKLDSLSPNIADNDAFKPPI